MRYLFHLDVPFDLEAALGYVGEHMAEQRPLHTSAALPLAASYG